MGESLFSKLLAKFVVAILVLAVIDLAYINWWVMTESQRTKELESQSVKTGIVQASDKNIVSSSPIAVPSPLPSADASQDKTVETRTVVEKQTQVIVQNAQKEIFIPIGTGSTKSSSYADLSGLEVNIDTDKYPTIDSVVFEASVYVDGGNGQMHTQLYNVTDKHPVWFSEINAGASQAALVTTPKITLEKGVRAYRVQAKTDLTEFAAHVENARIKITLK